MTDSSISDTAGVRWLDVAGRNVRVHAPENSVAATVAEDVLSQAEAIYGALQNLLQHPEEEASPIDVYLVDPVAEIPSSFTGDAPEEEPGGDGASRGAGARAGSGGLLHVVRGDEAPGSIARPLTRFVIARWYGEVAATWPLLSDGLAGVASGLAGTGPSTAEINRWVRTELGGAESASGPPGTPEPEGEGEEDIFELVAYPEDAPAAADGMGAPAAAASFVNFLLESDGGKIGALLEAYEPGRRDEALISVYHQPLAALEAEWMTRTMGSEGGTMSSLFGFLVPLLKPHWSRYFETIAYMLVGVLFTIAVPLVSGCVIDALTRVGAPPDAPEPGGFCGFVAPTLTRERVLLIVLVLLLGYVIENVLSLRKAWVEAKLFNDIGRDLRERMFRHLLRLGHRYYSDARVGDITANLSGDLDELQGSMQQIFGGGLMLVLTSVFAAVTAILQSPIVGALILLLIPVFLLTNRILGSRIANGSLEVQKMAGDSASLLQENLSAQGVVKAFGLEERVLGAYRNRLLATQRTAQNVSLWGQLYESTITFSTTIAQLIVLGLGAVFVIGGTIDDPGKLVALLLLLPAVIGPVASLADIGQVTQMAAGSVGRTKQVLDQPVDIEEKPDAVELPRLSKEIRYERVDFGYEPHRPVLKRLDLTIPAGTNVAIVGPSGSGKSTIASLLTRFWDPDSGRVTIDGIDIRDVTLSSLRDQIGIVFQDTFIFNSTVRDNIGIGRPGATDAEIEAAAKAAQLESFIAAQPQGFDTVLGERGVRMSGGQRQRLAIARALLRDPAILILDEATSALDARTEAEILETLSSIVQSRTTIAITHRLAMAASADLIVVLDEGKVAELGSHEELVRAGGLYQQLYQEQMSHAVPAERPRVALDAARLRKVPIFAGLDAARLAQLAEKLLPERYAAGEDVVRQGEAGDKLYLLTRGEAEVLQGDGRLERRVNSLIEGDYFGEYALLTGEQRSATVRATRPTEVYSLSKDTFTELVEADPELQEKMANLLTERRRAYAAAAEAAGLATAGV